MSHVSVLGANGEIVRLGFTSSANADLAQQLAGAVTQGVRDGSIAPFEYAGNPFIQSPPSGKSGELVQEKPGFAVLSAAYNAIVVNTNQATVLGGGSPDQTVLSGSGNLTFFSGQGSGFLAAGGGDNLIVMPNTGGGNWQISTGNGYDTILALSGNNAISAGTGDNSIVVGSGDNIVNSEGRDTIAITGNGADTIGVTGHHSDVVYGGSGLLTFLGGSGPSTVLGGTGSETVFGGSGKSYFAGGSAGNNVIFAGSGATTLVGGGDGDQLYAGGSHGDVLRAGSGNETLAGLLSSGNDRFYAGSGSDSIIAGTGSDTLFAGTGSATLVAGSGADIFAFLKGLAGGTDVISGFNPNLGQKLSLQGYGAHAVQQALQTQQHAGGSTTITLNDGTEITLVGLSHLVNSDFTH